MRLFLVAFECLRVTFDEVIGLIESVFAGLREICESGLEVAVEDGSYASVIVGIWEAGVDVERFG